MPEKNNARIAEVLADAKKKFAPDKRTVVFDVKGELDGNQLTLRGEIHNADLKNRLFDFIKKKENYSIIDSLNVLPRQALGEKIFGVVTVSVANIRTKPGHDNELATQALLGTPLRILKREQGWLYVQTPDEYLGWTDDMVAMFTKFGYEQWLNHPKIIVSTVYSHSYASTADRNDVVSDTVAGNILKLTGDRGKFYQVEYPNSKTAFVLKGDALPLDEWLRNAKDTPENIVATAKRFMGVPYLWGGTSTKAMDCSGFTKTVFFLNGVMLPRDASQQALVGEPVSIGDDYQHLKKGDLVFFGRKATADRGEKVTHVGIYLDNRKFIHEGGDVRINSFNPADEDFSEYRTEALLRAARVIGVGEDRGIRRLTSIPYYKSNEH